MRYYTATVAISGLNTARTLMYVTVASNKTVTIVSAAVTNASNETNEQIECTIQKVTTLGTPTATTLTPAKHDQGDAAMSSTVKGNVTASEPTYTSGVEVGREGAPSLTGWFFPSIVLPTEALPVLTGGDTWGLRILAAPTAFDAVVRMTLGEQG